MMHTVRDMSAFGAVIVVIMTSFTIMSMELFGHSLVGIFGENNIPYANFDTIGNAFVTNFIMLTGDGVGIIYMNHFRATPEASTFYTVAFILLGRLVLLNLFLAILLDNFQQDSLTKEIIKQKDQNEGSKTKPK
jgi:hypothetical protein